MGTCATTCWVWWRTKRATALSRLGVATSATRTRAARTVSCCAAVCCVRTKFAMGTLSFRSAWACVSGCVESTQSLPQSRKDRNYAVTLLSCCGRWKSGEHSWCKWSSVAEPSEREAGFRI
eukprot:2100319-Amphidinium_carterae.1